MAVNEKVSLFWVDHGTIYMAESVQEAVTVYLEDSMIYREDYEFEPHEVTPEDRHSIRIPTPEGEYMSLRTYLADTRDHYKNPCFVCSGDI